MNESPLRKFCESQHRWLIVAIVTTLFGLLVTIPLVDDYFDKKESRSALTEELDNARRTAKTLPEFEKRVAELTQELELVESREVSEKSVSRYRSTLVGMVRSAGCQVRRIDVSQPTVRPWNKNDDPLKKTPVATDPKNKTPFSLERRRVLLLVDGPMESIHGLLKGLNEDKTFAYPRRLELQSATGTEGKVTLELEMWLFALGRQKA
ncbi:MAG: hypothetical protein MI725_14350 [Pirellulales bacterium]|nr:hypothetical protein [Pirellulales bacterium]